MACLGEQRGGGNKKKPSQEGPGKMRVRVGGFWGEGEGCPS